MGWTVSGAAEIPAQEAAAKAPQSGAAQPVQEEEWGELVPSTWAQRETAAPGRKQAPQARSGDWGRGWRHRRLFPQVDFAPSPDRVTTVRSEMFWMKNVTCRILNRMLQPSSPQPRQPHHCPLRGFGMGEQRMLASGSPGAHPGHGFSEKDSYLPYREKH